MSLPEKKKNKIKTVAKYPELDHQQHSRQQSGLSPGELSIITQTLVIFLLESSQILLVS